MLGDLLKKAAAEVKAREATVIRVNEDITISKRELDILCLRIVNTVAENLGADVKTRQATNDLNDAQVSVLVLDFLKEQLG